MIVSSEINRPALELAGYFEHFAEERIQIIGMVEYSYLESLEDEVRTERYRKLLGFNVPCVIMCRDYVRHGHNADVRVDGAERIVCAFRARLRNCVEQGRLADVWQSDDTKFHGC